MGGAARDPEHAHMDSHGPYHHRCLYCQPGLSDAGHDKTPSCAGASINHHVTCANRTDNLLTLTPAKSSAMTIMNEGISVRTCHAKDLDTLVSLAIKTFRDTFDEFNSPENMLRYINKAFSRKAVEKEMQEPGTIFFLAFDGRKAVG